jgi:hypothetical protein
MLHECSVPKCSVAATRSASKMHGGLLLISRCISRLPLQKRARNDVATVWSLWCQAHKKIAGPAFHVVGYWYALCAVFVLHFTGVLSNTCTVSWAVLSPLILPQCSNVILRRFCSTNNYPSLESLCDAVTGRVKFASAPRCNRLTMTSLFCFDLPAIC